jgi:magnesium-transporting ATPase (P-type)
MKRPEGQNSKLYEVAGDSVESVSISLENSLRDLKMTDLSEIDVCMITRGDVLPFALAPENKQKFLELGLAAHSVICCRFAPRQKADVVNMVKEAGKMTLAIGDGGNDVVMIQAAHIGVGIRGKEGLQAARAADYQINYFRYLKRLVLVHGHYSFERTGFVGQYSYYKSFLFCFFQIAYGFYTGFSGNSLFDSACITAYNVLLFFPIISFVLDQDLRPDQLMTNPHVYKEGQKSINFNMKTYLLWNFRALVQGFIMFLLSIYCYQSNFTHINGGYQADYDSLGMVVFFAYLWLQSFTLFLELKYITLTNFIVIWFFHFLSIGLMVGLNYWLSFQSLHPYYATTMAMNDPSLWLSNILTVIFCLLPVIAVKYVNYNYFPREMDLLRLKLRTSDTSANAQPRGDALA